MNIGIDIDDTITNTYDTFLPMVAIKYGLDINRLKQEKISYDTLKEKLPDYDGFMAECFDAMARIIPVKDNAKNILNKLRKMGHKIIIITARNYSDYDNPYELTYEYLKANEIPFDKLLVNISDKGKECVLENIDLFIDDSYNNCKSVQEQGIEVLLMDAKFNTDKKDLVRVKDWEEIYTIINSMS